MAILPTEPSGFTSSITGDLQNRNELSNEKIVLPDECGDSLWNEVLAQDEHPDGMKNEQAYDAYLNREDLVKEQQSSFPINPSEKKK